MLRLLYPAKFEKLFGNIYVVKEFPQILLKCRGGLSVDCSVLFIDE